MKSLELMEMINWSFMRNLNNQIKKLAPSEMARDMERSHDPQLQKYTLNAIDDLKQELSK